MQLLPKLLITAICATIVSVGSSIGNETKSPEASLVSLIHMVKNEDALKAFYKEYNEEKKKNGKVSDEVEQIKQTVDCYSESFKDMTESEILEKLMMAWEFDIPQYDIALIVAKCAPKPKE